MEKFRATTVSDVQTNSGYNNFNSHVEAMAVTFMLPFATLDNILKEHTINDMVSYNIFVDVRSAIPKIYEEETKLELVKSYTVRNDKFVMSRGIIKLINHYAKYFRKKNLPYNIILFSESGDSLYHKKIDKEYKSKRKQSKLKAVSYNQGLLDNASSIIDYNIKTLEKVLNNIDNIYYFHLDYLEADFIPHYIKDKYGMNEETTNFNIILSNDKDLGQSINKNTIQIAYKSKEYKVFDEQNAFTMLKPSSVKSFNYDKLYDIKAFPYLLAIIGDSSDSVKGIPNLGFVGAYKYLNDLYTMGVIDFKSVGYEDFVKFISSLDLKDNTTKKMILNEEIFISAFKLVSFDALIDNLQYEFVEKIKSVVERTKTFSCEPDKMVVYNTMQKICSDTNLFSSLSILSIK